MEFTRTLTNRPHVAVSAYQILVISDGVREADVLECEHVVNDPVLDKALRLELVQVAGMVLVHQGKWKLQ